MGWPTELSQISTAFHQEISGTTTISQRRQEEGCCACYTSCRARLGSRSGKGNDAIDSTCLCAYSSGDAVERACYGCEPDGTASFSRCSTSSCQRTEDGRGRPHYPASKRCCKAWSCSRYVASCSTCKTKSAQSLGQVHCRCSSEMEQAYGGLRSSRCRAYGSHSGSLGEVSNSEGSYEKMRPILDKTRQPIPTRRSS